ncbi:hypothetical protein IL54_0479 [Sphingobium sp. ba1]|nr:hypothetical protein IL54_0479 [Sphingobium sp. ba1]
MIWCNWQWRYLALVIEHLIYARI